MPTVQPSRCRFLMSSPRWDVGPDDSGPQIAVAGRSNVGKSSLLNLLLGRKNLARTSSTPGRTQTINYYSVEERFLLVDLPGYGYAKAPLDVVQRWHRTIQTYVQEAPRLRAVVLLLDVRRDPSPEDREFAELVRRAGRRLIGAVTKCDKIGRGKRAGRLAAVGSSIGLAPAELVITSAQSGEGRRELWERMEAALAGGEPLDGPPGDDRGAGGKGD
jgi:GTP-binding protein